MSESEAVDLDFLMYFAVSDGMVDNSLRFLLVKSFWDLVVRWLIWAHNNQILKGKIDENFKQIALTNQISL